MRWLVLLILVLLAVFYFLPEPEPVPAEESFIGDQVKALNKAKGFEQDYLDATKKRQEEMEKQLEEDTGG